MSALNKKSFLTYLKEGGIYVVLLVLLAIIIFQDPTFLSLLNLSNILTQSSVRIIIALGVAGLIVTQGTDLSAGRQVGLAAVVAATLLQSMDNAKQSVPGNGDDADCAGYSDCLCYWRGYRFDQRSDYCLSQRDAVYYHARHDDHRLWHQLALLRLRWCVADFWF